MNVVVVGLNHRTAPVALREQFALSEEALGQALYHIKQDPVVGEALILSTCNRVEIYAVVTDTEKGCQAVSEFFLNRETSLGREALAAALYAFVAKDCVKHLFRVASSLDSMVIGEPQILGQVKDAFENALQHKATGTILNKVFKKAISVAKRIRTETKIAESAVSVSFAAVQLAKKIFGRLDQKSVMLVGAGEMAELAARHFLANGAQTLLIANRNYERSLELASEYNGMPVKFEDFTAELYQSDIVLCATGAPHYIISFTAVSRVIAARQNRPIFFIDISVPRNIDPAINQLDNVFLYDMDDLKLATESSLRMREAEALKAEEMITQETEQIVQWYKSLDAVPLILAVKERAEAIRHAEAARVLDKLSLTPAQQKAIEKLTLSLVNKLLHFPLATLKEEACSTNGSMVLESARRLFLPTREGEATAPVGHGKTLDVVTKPTDNIVPEEITPEQRPAGAVASEWPSPPEQRPAVGTPTAGAVASEWPLPPEQRPTVGTPTAGSCGLGVVPR